MFHWLSFFRPKKIETAPKSVPITNHITMSQVLEELESWYDNFYTGGGTMEVDFYVWEELVEKIRKKQKLP